MNTLKKGTEVVIKTDHWLRDKYNNSRGKVLKKQKDGVTVYLYNQNIVVDFTIYEVHRVK